LLANILEVFEGEFLRRWAKSPPVKKRRSG
jgi:hypothetical protein